MGARRNEKLAEMSHDERLARQKRKDRQKKAKIAERQERYISGFTIQSLHRAPYT